MVLLVILCQTLVYREVTALFSLKGSKPDLGNTESKGKDPWSKTLNWYFFAVTNYFLYGESIIYYFKVVHLSACRVGFILHLTAARCLRGCTITSVRHKSPDHQFYPVHDRICRVRDVAEKRISQTAIRPILLGAHELAPHCRLQVCDHWLDHPAFVTEMITQSLHRKQYTGRAHLVLGPGLTRHL
jgi:hypothetical protein